MGHIFYIFLKQRSANIMNFSMYKMYLDDSFKKNPYFIECTYDFNLQRKIELSMQQSYK